MATTTNQKVLFLMAAVVLGVIAAGRKQWWLFASMALLVVAQSRDLWRARHADRPRAAPTGDRGVDVRGEPRD